MYINNPTLDYLPENVVNLIPQHKKGNVRDTISFLSSDPSVASSNFTLLKQRLFNINNWGDYCTKTPVEFKIHNANCEFLDRYVKLNDLVKIEVPFLNLSSSINELFIDWVKVTKVIEEDNDDTSLILIQLTPIINPSNDSDEIEHFYDQCASNTFILFRNQNTISLSIHGRNESINYKTKSKLKAFRNLLVANIGFIGLDNLLWYDFAEKLLNK